GKRLKINGFESGFIIGDMQQSKRLETLNNFKAGKFSILVATDVAARGIDVNDLAMVVNYDLPNEPENYVHRIGRTARAGKSGKAYTFCSEKDVYDLPVIERYIDKQIPSSVCSDDQLAEDKSKGVYIKLDSYGWGGDDERDGRDSRGGRRDDRRSRDGNRGRGDRLRRGDRRDDRSDKKPRQGAREFDKNLEGLSFDERMALYKKKYGEGAASHKGKKFDKRRDDRRSNKDWNKKRGQKPAAQAPKKTLQNRGIVGFFKSLFGKKK
ncbi:MAG: DEAD/DEAH box helicase, partial [Treponema sp.]|nr:DEAD/DEAH box helicase [Treponema sp.]